MRALRLLLLATTVLITMPSIHAASPANPALSSTLQAIVSDPARPLSSLSALVIRGGQVVFEGHYGQRVVATGNAGIAGSSDKGMAPDHDTLYRMASISKLVTTIGAMRLVDAGQLDLDADIGQYLGYKVRNPHFADTPITTRMLLNHTSSLRDDGGYFFSLETSLKNVLQQAVGRAGQGAIWAVPEPKSDHSPGRYFTYCNLNFGVVGTVIEAITRQRFDLYMQKEVLQPLGIAGGFTPETLAAADIAHVAVLYRKGRDNVWDANGPWVPQVDDFQGKTPTPRAGLDAYVPGTNATGFGPQGGLRTSVGGLGLVMQMLMNRGTLNGVRMLSPQAVSAMLQPQWRANPNHDNGDTGNGFMHAWGLGTQRFVDVSGPSTGDRFLEHGGLTGVGHMGFAYGLESGFIFDPLTRNGVVYAIGGVSADPDQNRGHYSAYSVWQERTLDALWRLAVQRP
jgi:CubicO group peptidase (beta-lactamase class C family)